MTVGEGAAAVIIRVRYDLNEEVQVWCDPSVATWEQHELCAAAMLTAAKLAASIASHCDGKLYQEATVAECLYHLKNRSNLVAEYPDTPLDFKRLCPGLQRAVIAGG